ncbi:hypothetical protein WICPIJ_007755 [Wickerhamomyces pijperi]|uniref:Uncharacterized protein n=1 Tax=Wickerhamomyces pijperi TaxID=599730 RepID=A0A9P8Q1U6_WICPI|nr:hypothetical protein WICPIJ_007755 [Wickerhamomyces pijperi]
MVKTGMVTYPLESGLAVIVMLVVQSPGFVIPVSTFKFLENNILYKLPMILSSERDAKDMVASALNVMSTSYWLLPSDSTLVMEIFVGGIPEFLTCQVKSRLGQTSII